MQPTRVTPLSASVELTGSVPPQVPLSRTGQETPSDGRRSRLQRLSQVPGDGELPEAGQLLERAAHVDWFHEPSGATKAVAAGVTAVRVAGLRVAALRVCLLGVLTCVMMGASDLQRAAAQNPVRGVIRPPIGSRPWAVQTPTVGLAPTNSRVVAPRPQPQSRPRYQRRGRWCPPRFYGFPYYGVYRPVYNFPTWYGPYPYGYTPYLYGYYGTGVSIRLGSRLGVVGWAVPGAGFVPRSIYFGRIFGRPLWFSSPLPPEWPLAKLVEEPTPAEEQRLRQQAIARLENASSSGQLSDGFLGVPLPDSDGQDPRLQLVSSREMRSALRRMRTADKQFRQGAYADAVRTYRRVIAEGSGLAEPHLHFGFALLANGQPKLAGQQFVLACEEDLEWVRDEFDAEAFYAENWQAFPTHLEQLAAATYEHPEDASLLLAVGLCLEFDGQVERAAPFLAEAARQQPRWKSWFD